MNDVYIQSMQIVLSIAKFQFDFYAIELCNMVALLLHTSLTYIHILYLLPKPSYS